MIKQSIAVFVKNLTSGGAEKQSVLLAKAMTEKYNVHYIILNGKHVHQKYLDMLNVDGNIQVVTFQGCLFSRFLQFVKYIRNNHINYIFSYLTAANMFACIAGRIGDAKVVTGLRNAKLPWAKHIADRFLTNHLADLTVCNCYSGKDNFSAHGFCGNKIVVIPNCFEHITPYKEKDVREQVKVITVGRFVAQKDYETAIRAIQIAGKKCADLRFVVVGYGELEQQIRLWIKQYDIEKITTIYINPDNIPDLLSEADIYLSTSLFEGTSNSIMEGMNADLPIIATNVGDNYMLVKNGNSGFLHNVKDAENLAKSLVSLYNDRSLRVEMGCNSKKILEDCYSVDIFRNQYISLIEKL